MAYKHEHFAGASLPADWTAIVAGGGTITINDSNVVGTSSATGDACAIYKRFDQTRSQIIMLCGRQTSAPASTNAFPYPAISLVHSATAPVCDTRANLSFLARIIGFTTGSVDYQRLLYVDTGGTNNIWQESSQSFATGGTTLSMPAATPRDEYRIFGLQWDAQGQRLRLVAMHTVTGTVENADLGPRLVALSDWVPLSSIQNGTSTTLWLVIGWPETNFFTVASAWEVEWIAETWGKQEFVLCNGKATIGSNYDITAHTGYDLRAPFLVPGSRTQAIPVGTSGQFDDSSTQWGSIFRDDDGVYVSSYSADAGGGVVTIGLATATDPAGTWTKQGQIINVGGSGSTYESRFSFNVLFKDWSEADPSKRYKVIAKGFDAGLVGRTLLFTAATRGGTYTYQGELIAEDATETSIAFRGQPVWYRGRWWLFYNCDVAGVNTVRAASAKRFEVGAFTKQNVTLSTEGQNAVEQAITAISGRTITVASTTGCVQDMLVVITNSTSGDTYGLSRIRKVVSSTQLELYHSVPGMTTSSVMRSANFGTDNALNAVVKIDDTWCFVMTVFKVFTSHATLAAHHETNGLFIGGATPFAASAISWLATPIAPLGRDSWNTTISNENMRVSRDTQKFTSGWPVRRRQRSDLIRR